MTAIDVCNLALAYLGNTQSIGSMAEQSVESVLCGRFYNLTRESLLKQYAWNFAVKTEPLVLTTETDDVYGFVYEYPGDCLRALLVGTAGAGNVVNDYAVRTVDDNGTMIKRVACDVENARIQYVFDLQTEEDMPSEFVDALALALASRLAMPMSSAPQITQTVSQQAAYALENAKRMCAMEQRQPPITSHRYTDARR